MAERAAASAARRHLAVLQQALGCVTHARLSFPSGARLTLDAPFDLALQSRSPVPLRGETRLLLIARQPARVVEGDRQDSAFDTPYRVEVIGYFYQFTTPDTREVLAFHWTPKAADPTAVAFPHLHVGPVILGGQATIRPRDLHKAHIPTGHVTVAAVVRLAIAEFGVAPLRPDWDRILRAAEAGDGGVPRVG